MPFIVTDLSLAGRVNLKALAEAFEEAGLYVMLPPEVRGGVWKAKFQTCLYKPKLEKDVRRFLEVIEGLTPELRALWDRLSVREFDVGFSSTTDRFAMKAI